jgi:hypothetical protein
VQPALRNEQPGLAINASAIIIVAIGNIESGRFNAHRVNDSTEAKFIERLPAVG